MVDLPSQEPAPLRAWLAGPMEPAAAATIERVRRAAGVVHVAVLPDVHVARDVCVGTAMATVGWLYPAAVGGDIGCGMLSVPLDADVDLLRDPGRAGRLLRLLGRAVPTTRHHRLRTVPLPAELESTDLSHGSLSAVLKDVGRLQLGTLGGGNHFIEFGADTADGRLWLTIHSGSRGMGQAVRGHHVTAATVRSAGMMAVDARTDAGRAYLHDQRWARSYAAAIRAAMASAIVALLRDEFAVSADAGGTISCDHNHVAEATVDGRPAWVHRKGAMPAGGGVAGVVPGSMGTLTYHVVGRGCAAALDSSAHGAGRAYSRAAARERFGRSDVRQQLRDIWFDPRLTDSLREELPKAYKDVRAVMRAQADLVDVTRTLRPVLVYKGT
jgi:tRNA-splicing ligase RtcB